jgi:hypothetical protein
MVRASDRQTQRGHVLQRLAKETIEFFVAGGGAVGLSATRFPTQISNLCTVRSYPTDLERWDRLTPTERYHDELRHITDFNRISAACLLSLRHSARSLRTSKGVETVLPSIASHPETDRAVTVSSTRWQ